MGTNRWQGLVRVEGDVLVARGATLTIEAGTRVVFATAEGTKTDPAQWSTGTELAVEGELTVLGTKEEPVVFEGEGAGGWGGIIAGPGARVSLEEVTIRGAQEGLLCVGSACSVRDARLVAGEYGIVIGPDADLNASGVSISRCRVGVLDVSGRGNGRIVPAGIEIDGATDAALLGASPPELLTYPLVRLREEAGRVEFLGEYTVERDESWRGVVIVGGRVTVAPGAVLTLEPGTHVAFRRTDSNDDGLGEGELLVLGGIRSRGTLDAPVVFDSAEDDPKPGDWDKVSLISSEDPDNAFSYSVFRYGTQALHAHFSRLTAADCLFDRNIRAVQFQESEGVTLARCVFRENKQALRFRDSRVTAAGNVLVENLYAVHAFRSEVEFEGNTLSGNRLGGFFAKESKVAFRSNRLLGNRDGVRMKDPESLLELSESLISASSENAVSLSQVRGEVRGSRIDGAGLDLLGVEASAVRLSGNALGASGRHAVHVKDAGAEVDARGNFWGEQPIAERVFDRGDDPSLGTVLWSEPLALAPDLRVPGRSW